MKVVLKRSFDWNGKVGPQDIRNAVEYACAPDTAEDSSVVGGRERARNTSDLVARLVDVLHEKGVLADTDVLTILGGIFEPANDWQPQEEEEPDEREGHGRG